MKVLHVVSGDLWAGAEVQVYTLLERLARKAEVAVIILNDGELFRRCKSLGIDTILLDESTLSSWAIIKGIKDTVRGFKPDILHTHRMKENIFGYIASRSIPSTIMVRTCHGSPEFRYFGFKKVLGKIDDAIGHYSTRAIIAVSEDLRKQLEKKFPPENLYVIKNGVKSGSNELHTKDLDEFPPGRVNIAIIGRLQAVKRIDIFIHAARQLNSLYGKDRLLFHIIGEGPIDEDLKTIARSIGITDNLVFHGFRNDIQQCLKSIDLLVMCSDHEGTPMIALEALAVGVGVVAHKIGGLPEILSNHPELLVSDHTPEGYAEKLNELLCNEKPKHYYLPSCYTAEYNSESTLNLYSSLLNSQH